MQWKADLLPQLGNLQKQPAAPHLYDRDMLRMQLLERAGSRGLVPCLFK